MLKGLALNFGSYGSAEQSQIVGAYADGYWSEEYIKDLSFNGRIQSIISMMSCYYLLFLSIINKNKSDFLIVFVCLYIFFLSLFSFSDTLFLRYATVGTMLLPIYIICYFR
ncbi:hypothetical protein, partial [Vibrio jasicida]|uniref:hypothetical protein n=1 Tax=Vibrio jasicida TaxID=766224 RepID=UPI001CA534EE